MKKRLLPALLALVMVLGMLPLTVFADNSSLTIPTTEPSGHESSDLDKDSTANPTINGEGASLDGGKYYTVSEWLYYVNTDLKIITDANGVLTKRGAIVNVSYNLNGAKEADKNTSEAKKSETATLIQGVEAEIAKVTKLELNPSEDKYKLVDFGALLPFTGLTELNLSGALQDSVTTIPQQIVESWSNLTTLKLSGNKLEDVNALVGLTGLKVLDLSNNAIADKTNEAGAPVGGVSALASCTALESVNLSGNAGLTRIDGLSNCASLKTLNLTGTKVTSLAPLANCTKMTSLDVSGLTLTSLGSVDQLKNITSLTMTETKLEATDENKDSMMAAVKALNAAKPGIGLKLVDTSGQEIELTYQIQFVINGQQGSAQVSAERAKAGDTVTVSKVTAKEGYAFSKFVITHQGKAVTPVNSTDDGCTFTMPADDVSIEVVFESTDPDAPPADNILVTLNNGGIFGQQIKIDRLDSTKYYVVQLQKQVGDATCSVAYKLSGATTQTLNVLPLAAGNSYKVQIAVSDTDSNDLADYGEDWIYETTFTG